MKWLCWFGFHDWDYGSITIANITVKNRTCCRCAREQIYAAGGKVRITVKP